MVSDTHMTIYMYNIYYASCCVWNDCNYSSWLVTVVYINIVLKLTLIIIFVRYITVLVEMTRFEGTRHGKLIASQMLDVTIRVKDVRPFSVRQMVWWISEYLFCNAYSKTRYTEKNVSLWLLCGVQHSVIMVDLLADFIMPDFIMPETQQPIIIIILIIYSPYLLKSLVELYKYISGRIGCY